MQMTGCEEDALDAVHWTFLRLMETPFEHRSDAETLSWLYRTATHRCLQLIRSRTRRHELGIENRERLRPACPDMQVDLERRELLELALRQVDDRCGEVALLTVFQGLSIARAAEALEVSDRTVIRKRKQFARVLRTLMDEAAS